MDKENKNSDSPKNLLRNRDTDIKAEGSQKNNVINNTNHFIEDNSFIQRRVKDSAGFSQDLLSGKSSSSKKEYFNGKYEDKKKKALVSGNAESSSPKCKKYPKKQEANKANFDCSDVLDKMYSPNNLRKTSKSSKKIEKASLTPDASQNSLSCDSFLELPKARNKYRSKTPDIKKTTGTPNRKSIPYKKFQFEPYIPLFQVQKGLKRGEFIEGALRINPRNYEDAYVSSPDGKMDIYIGGMQNRNRALNGDIVVVQINPKQEWKVLCDAIKDYQEKSGKNFVETICEPVVSSATCKVHTPDPFITPRPYSSNSWDATCGRSPDTLEILGLDKLTKQFENLSVEQRTPEKVKNKQKNKCKKNKKSNSSAENGGASSTHNSPDNYDKIISNHTKKDERKTVLQENPMTEVKNDDSLSKKELGNHSAQQTFITKNVEGFKEFIKTSDNTAASENLSNLIISPEELLQIDGNSILNNTGVEEMDHFNDDNDQNNSNIVIVAPDELSGDEFTDSASVDSSYSEHIEKIIEDSEFLACQQDSANNNLQTVIQNSENVINITNNNESLITFQPSKTSISLDDQCKMQYKKSVSSIISFPMNSEVMCSTISDVFSNEQISAVNENTVVQNLNVREFSATPVPASDIAKSKAKKHKNRKKKKKSIKNAVNNPYDLIDSIYNLTVDEVLQHPEWSRFVQKTGKVVYILERKHSCLVAGHLRIFQDRNPNWALFSPNDSRVPRIMIPMSDCPQNFYHRFFDYTNVLFIAEITQWDENSSYAFGRLVQHLGNSGDIEVETLGILIENGVNTEEFKEEVLQCLPETQNWTMPAEELCYRRDFRKHCVFTIDPSTARDMDDAVSCISLDNGNYEVGVHIADVTYFVQEDTELDKVAKERSTSVYLVEKVIPMLPRELCDDLCSLNPGKDRLTFSVVWEISPEGDILNQWIGRSIINSCIKLSYEHAQDMIEHPNRTWIPAEHPEIHGSFKIEDIIYRVHQLHHLAVKLRNKRFLDGALHLDQVKLQFTLDPQTSLPLGFNVFVQKDSNKLIEEFMLLANMSVAAKIYETFPTLSLLRRHPPPQTKPMHDIISMCESMGIVLDSTTSGTLQNSIAKYKGGDYFSKAMVLVLMNLCSKPMNCALYFCTGVLEEPSLFHHYALNVPLYTHFTSPIRRYPDIIVHRLLGAALHYNMPPKMDAVTMQKCATHCNDKKYNAKRVSELSSELFLAAFIRSLGSVHTKAMVIGVMDHSFDCLILEMGIIKRVYCDKLPLLKKEYTRTHGVSYLNITWKDDEIKEGVKQTIIMFTLINVILTVEKESLQIRAALEKPQN